MSVLVRAFEPKDWEKAWQVARITYPELYGKVNECPPMQGFDKAWVVAEDGKIIGFAFLLGQYISEVAVLVDDEKGKRKYVMPLLWEVLRYIRTVGGKWSANCRLTTSYRFLKTLEAAQRIRIIKEAPIEEEPAELGMVDEGSADSTTPEDAKREPRISVFFEVLER